MTMTQATPTPTRPGAMRWLIILVHVTAVLILIEAWLAGQFLMGLHRSTFIDIHRDIGGLIALLALAQLVLAVLAGIPAGMRNAIVGVNVLLFILVIIQLILGYAAGRAPTAWHIFNGVVIFGLIAADISLSLRARRTGA